MMPSGVLPMIASSEDSTMAASCARSCSGEGGGSGIIADGPRRRVGRASPARDDWSPTPAGWWPLPQYRDVPRGPAILPRPSGGLRDSASTVLRRAARGAMLAAILFPRSERGDGRAAGDRLQHADLTVVPVGQGVPWRARRGLSRGGRLARPGGGDGDGA